MSPAVLLKERHTDPQPELTSGGPLPGGISAARYGRCSLGMEVDSPPRVVGKLWWVSSKSPRYTMTLPHAAADGFAF